MQAPQRQRYFCRTCFFSTYLTSTTSISSLASCCPSKTSRSPPHLPQRRDPRCAAHVGRARPASTARRSPPALPPARARSAPFCARRARRQRLPIHPQLAAHRQQSRALPSPRDGIRQHFLEQYPWISLPPTHFTQLRNRTPQLFACVFHTRESHLSTSSRHDGEERALTAKREADTQGSAAPLVSENEQDGEWSEL